MQCKRAGNLLQMRLAQWGMHHYGACEITPEPALKLHWNVLSLSAMTPAGTGAWRSLCDSRRDQG